MDKVFEQLLEFLKTLSPLISVPLLIAYGGILLFLVKKIGKMKDERIRLAKEATTLKDQQISYLQQQISDLQRRDMDPRGILAEVEIIRTAAEEKVNSAKRNLEETFKKLGSKEAEIEQARKAYNELLNELEKTRTRTEGLNQEIFRKELEAQKDQMYRTLESLAHEILSPLTGIQAHADFILHFRERADKERIYLKLKDILSQVKLIENIIGTIRSTGGLDLVKKRVQVYHDIINPAIQLLTPLFKAKDIHYSISYELQHAPEILADPQVFQRIIFNVLSNAIKYSNAGAEISVDGKIEGNMLHIDTSNQPSIEIPECDAEKVFEKFYRSTGARAVYALGSGLGLYFVKTLIEQHGGTAKIISFKNPVTIRLTIPVGDKA